MIKNSICPVCNKKYQKLSHHVSMSHPEFAKEQKELVCDLYKQGMCAEKIAELPNIIYAGKSGVVKVIRKNFSKDTIEEMRRRNISKSLLASYAAGEREYIKDINANRVRTKEARRKNSEGLKKAYAEGRKKSWNKGLSKITDDRLKAFSEKISNIMQEKFNDGELNTTFGSGEDSPFWKKDRSSITYKYRNGLNFTNSDRKNLLKLYKYKCGFCKISAETLRRETELLGSKRNKLEADHIIPVKNSGKRDWKSNGQILCSRCHIIKSLKEKHQDVNDRYEKFDNKYNNIPSALLLREFGGEVFNEYNIWSKDGVRVFICPLTVRYADYKYLQKDLKEEYDNLSVYFADEWNQKREIVLSMIRNKLKSNNKKVYARNTMFKKISLSDSKEFLNRNHISGGSNSSFSNFGLYYKDELVSVLSFKKPFTKKHRGKLEIARFASKLNLNVVGGFSKLLKNSLKDYSLADFKTLITYADLRFGTGNVYLKNGFELVGSTKLDYFYTDGYTRMNRFKFRASDGKSEAQVAKENNVYKIYGCGSNIYEMSI